jgi:hypothetical protein
VRGRRHGERDDHRASRLSITVLLAVSTLGWIFRGVAAVVAVLFIYLIGAGILRKFKVAPEQEPDPQAVVPVNIRYRCIVCGAEVTMTAAQGTDEEPEAPRHCREDMVPV